MTTTTMGGIGPVQVDVYVRELGRHSGLVSLSLALGNLHSTVPMIRGALHDFYVDKISSLIVRDRLPSAIQTAMDFGRSVQAEEWGVSNGIVSVPITCEARHIVGDEFDQWTRALFERAGSSSSTNNAGGTTGSSNSFVLGPALVYREEGFDCLLQIVRVSPAQTVTTALGAVAQSQQSLRTMAASPFSPPPPSAQTAVHVHAELCVLSRQRTDLARYVQLATEWAKSRIERCAADVRWHLFWRQVKRSNYRGELHSFIFEEDIIGEQARVSLTMIDPRFDDLLTCIEHKINWLGPLQRMLSSQPSWLIATLRTRNSGQTDGLLITRENCADRFAVFAVAEDGEKSMLFDLFYRVDSDLRTRNIFLEEMLSLLLRTLGALFLDSCIMRVADAFANVGLETMGNAANEGASIDGGDMEDDGKDAEHQEGANEADWSDGDTED